jgi:hypothetical protein
MQLAKPADIEKAPGDGTKIGIASRMSKQQHL